MAPKRKKKKKKQKHECDQFLMFMHVINAAAVAYEPSKPLVLEDVEVAPPQVTLIFLSFHLTGRYASAWTGRSEIHLNATLEDFSMMLRCTIKCAVFSNTFNKHFVSNMFCFFFLVYPVVFFCFLWV
jgi:hypothetical protein